MLVLGPAADASAYARAVLHALAAVASARVGSGGTTFRIVLKQMSAYSKLVVIADVDVGGGDVVVAVVDGGGDDDYGVAVNAAVVGVVVQVAVPNVPCDDELQQLLPLWVCRAVHHLLLVLLLLRLPLR